MLFYSFMSNIALLTISFRYRVVTFLMLPCFTGSNCGVWRQKLYLDRLERRSNVWAIQFFINNSICRFNFTIFSSTFMRHFPNKSAVIHALLFASYSRGSVSRTSKHRVFYTLLIERILVLSIRV